VLHIVIDGYHGCSGSKSDVGTAAVGLVPVSAGIHIPSFNYNIVDERTGLAKVVVAIFHADIEPVLTGSQK
jgi:hypothetical protein